MEAQRQRQVISLARPAVARLAPDELPLLDATTAAVLRRDGRWRTAQRPQHTDERQHFDPTDSLPVVALAAVGAAQAVLGFLAGQVVEAVRDEASQSVKSWLARWWRRRHPPVPVKVADGEVVLPLPPLTKAQLKRVRRVAYERTVVLGMDRKSASLIADAIVGQLSISDPPEDGAPGRGRG
ncbi:hypothetical protein WEI85_30275 [Actinomycetes bacterium KLBMP 9797]